MKSCLIALLVVLMTAPSAFASSKKKRTTVKTAAPSSESPAAPARESEHPNRRSWKPSASFGLGSIGSRFHLGVLGKYETETTVQGTPIDVGGKTGFLLGADTPGGWVIPILATAAYEIRNGGGLRPYVGVDIGIAIVHVSGRDVLIPGLGVVSASDTSVKFAALVVPGVHLTREIFAELPFGTIAGSFTLLPSVGMHF